MVSAFVECFLVWGVAWSNDALSDERDDSRLLMSTDVIQLTLSLKITTAQVVETSVTVNNNSYSGYVHPDDQTQPAFEIQD